MSGECEGRMSARVRGRILSGICEREFDDMEG